MNEMLTTLRVLLFLLPFPSCLSFSIFYIRRFSFGFCDLHKLGGCLNTFLSLLCQKPGIAFFFRVKVHFIIRVVPIRINQ
jgi:hypothetical protein